MVASVDNLFEDHRYKIYVYDLLLLMVTSNDHSPFYKNNLKMKPSLIDLTGNSRCEIFTKDFYYLAYITSIKF